MSNGSTGKFLIGDQVVFRLGEREDWVCPACTHHVFNSEFEEWLIQWSGKTFTIANVLAKYHDSCPQCQHAGGLTKFDYSLEAETRIYLGNTYSNFEVFERELIAAGGQNVIAGVVA